MQRQLALAGLIVLLVLGTVVLLSSKDPAGDAPDATGDATWADTDSATTTAKGEAPTLRGSTREDGPAADTGKGSASADLPKESTGPYEFVVVDFESEALVADVEISDAQGEALGSTDEDGTLLIEDLEGSAGKLPYRASKDGYVTQRNVAKAGEVTRVVLEKGVAISGKVIDGRSNRPVADASIVVWDEDHHADVAAVRSDEKGRFRIRAVRPHHPVLFVVQGPGVVPHVQQAMFHVEVKDFELRIGEGGRIVGRVATPEDKPLEGVEVRLLSGRGPLYEHTPGGEREERADARLRASRGAVTRTNEKGEYEFVGVPLKQLMVPAAVLKPRHVVRPPHGAFFDDLGETKRVDIEVDAPSSLRIRIEDDDGGRIGNADVHIATSKGYWPLVPGDAHPKGGYLLKDVTPGVVTITAALPGAPNQTKYGRLKAGEESEILLVFPVGRRIHGTVSDKRGQPLWKAGVGWRGDDKGEFAEVRTDNKGRFELKRLVSTSGTLYVGARELPWTPWAYEAKELERLTPSSAPLEIQLLDGTRAFGTFEDLPKGTVVTSSLAGGSRFDMMDHRVKPDGEFRRRGPHPRGRGCVFVFRTRGFPPLLLEERRPFDSEEVRDLGPLTFVATNPRLGRVVDEMKRPVHGAKVTVTTSWSGRTTRSDTLGDFSLPRMPDKRIPIVVEVKGFPKTPAVLHTPSQYQRQLIYIRRSAKLTVVVPRTEKQKGPPLALYIEAEAENWRYGDPPPLQRIVKMPKERVTVHLPAGKYKLVAYVEKTRLIATEKVEVKAGPDQTVELKLERRR